MPSKNKPGISALMRLGVTALLISLAACGGGGNKANAPASVVTPSSGTSGAAVSTPVSGSSSSPSSSTSTSANGGLYFASLDYPDMYGVVGQSLSFKPSVLTGVPANAALEFSATNLPAGIGIDRLTGVVSGTPTAPATNVTGTISAAAKGFEGLLSTGYYFNVIPAPLYSWSRVSTSVPDLLKFDLANLGGVLYAFGVSAKAVVPSSTEKTQVWRSADAGATWANVTPSNGPALRHFALTSDGVNAYIMGGDAMGTGLNTSEVWRYSGTAWTRVAVSTPFSPRRRHAAVRQGSSLFVLGGVQDNGIISDLNEGLKGYLNDVWRSDDNGANWVRQTGAAAFSPRFGHCAVNLAGKLLMIGGYDGPVTTQSTATAIYESTDGITWKPSTTSLPPGTPFLMTDAACAVHRGRVLVLDGSSFIDESGLGQSIRPTNPDHGMIYSSDGAQWTDEFPVVSKASATPNFEARHRHGMAVVGDSLVVVGGHPYQSPTVNEAWRTLP